MLKFILIVLLAFAGLAVIYFIAAFLCSSICVNCKKVYKDEVEIYILSNGVHTDIVVPVKTEQVDWSKIIKYENTTGKDTTLKFLGIGWGDKGFYMQTPTWADLKLSVAFKATFGLGGSAMHATFYREMQEGERCIRMGISKAEYQQLIDFVITSFRKDADGNVVHIKTNAVYGTTDAFYEAVGTFSLFQTCNTWTNKALKACGQRACLWTPFQSGIFYQYKK